MHQLMASHERTTKGPFMSPRQVSGTASEGRQLMSDLMDGCGIDIGMLTGSSRYSAAAMPDLVVEQHDAAGLAEAGVDLGFQLGRERLRHRAAEEM